MLWFIVGVFVGGLLYRQIDKGNQAGKQPDRAFRNKNDGQIWHLEAMGRDPTGTDAWIYIISTLNVTGVRREAWTRDRLAREFEEVYRKGNDWQPKNWMRVPDKPEP